MASRRGRWVLLGAAVVVLVSAVLVGLVLVSPFGRHHPAPYTWGPAAVDGGGFMTVLAPSPHTEGLWLAGSDVAGVFRSTDGGRTWTGASLGFEAKDQRKVGAIEWDPFDARRAWACVGTASAHPSGAVVRTTDGGVTWTTASTAVFCSGGPNTLTDVGADHPRSTGRLLVADPTREGRLWIGTLDGGVARSDDAGETWTVVGLQGLPIRGLALDPAYRGTLYVAVRTTNPPRGGLYRVDDADAARPTWQRLAGPTVGEEVSIVGRHLYLAAGAEGVWRADLYQVPVALQRTVGSGLPASAATDVATVSAVKRRGADEVLVGLDQHAPCQGGFCPTLFESDDGGAAWRSLPTSAAGVHPQVGGAAGPTWRQAAVPATLLGGTDHVTSDVRVDPFVTGHLLLAGRSGLWRSTDGGTTWYPAPSGLAVTFHGRPAVDPTRPGAIVVPTADWKLLGSDDDGEVVEDLAFPADGHDASTVARLTVSDPSRSTPLYVGEDRSSRARRAADVLVQPAAGGSFRSTGFADAAGAAGVLAVAARDVAGQRIVVVVSRGQGVWRKSGDGPWTRTAVPAGGADDPAMIARTATVAWAADGTLYLADRGRAASTGVWRSRDAGASWDRLTSERMDIGLDPSAPHRLWMAGADEVWRVDDARDAVAGAHLADLVTRRPDARLVAVDSRGRVVVVTAQAAGPVGKPGERGDVFRSTDRGRSFRRVGGDAVARGLVDPLALVISPTGAVHIVTFGFGWWVGRPVAGDGSVPSP